MKDLDAGGICNNCLKGNCKDCTVSNCICALDDHYD